MLFLVSGASGVGKSTVRRLLTPRLGPAFAAVELCDLAPTDAVTMRWRQETVEVAAALAVELRLGGRHVLLCGDPVAPAEVVAAPSAPHVGGVAACVLDADRHAQAARLHARGDDPALLDAHHGFADWMREHAADPLPRLDLLTQDPAPDARWARVADLVDRGEWHVPVIDTSRQDPAHVADTVETWIRAVLAGDGSAMPAGVVGGTDDAG